MDALGSNEGTGNDEIKTALNSEGCRVEAFREAFTSMITRTTSNTTYCSCSLIEAAKLQLVTTRMSRCSELPLTLQICRSGETVSLNAKTGLLQRQ
jgi:hypothetical protein